MAGNLKTQRRYIVSFILILLIGVLGVYFTKSDMGLRLIYSIARQQIERKLDYTLSIDDIAKHPYTGIRADKVEFTSKDSSIIVEIDTMNIHYSGIFEILGRQHVNVLRLSNPKITVRIDSSSGSGDMDMTGMKLPEMLINKLLIDNATICINTPDTSIIAYVKTLDLRYSGQPGQAQLNVFDLAFCDSDSSIFVRDFSSHVTVKNNIIKLKNLNFLLNGAEISAVSKIRFTDALRFQGDFSVHKADLSDYVDLPFVYKNEKVDLDVTVSGDPNEFTGSVSVKGKANHMDIDMGQIDFEFKDETFYLLQAKFSNAYNDIALFGSFGFKDRYVNATVSIYDLSPEFWISDIKAFDVNGRLRAKGYLDDEIKLNYKINADNIYGLETAGISGDITMLGLDTLVLDTNNYFQIPNGKLSLSGTVIGFDSLDLKMHGFVKEIGDIDIGGDKKPELKNVTIAMSGKGHISDPSIEFNANIDSLAYDKLSTENIKFSIYGRDFFTNPKGTALISLEDIRWDSLSVNKLETYVTMEDQDVVMEFLDIDGKGYEFSLCGSMSDYEIFTIDKMTGVYEDQSVYLLDTVSLTLRDDYFKLSPFEVLYKDAYLFGQFSLIDQILDGKLSILGADINSLPKVIAGQDSISGIVDMDITVDGSVSDPELSSILSIKKGRFFDVGINSVAGRLEYGNDKLSMKDVDIQFEDERYIRGMMQLPMDIDFGSYEIIRLLPEGDLSGIWDVHNIRMKKLLGLMTNEIDVGGELSLDANIFGTLGKPRLESDLSLSYPSIDLIKLDTIQAAINYKDKKLYFNDVFLESSQGEYKGFAYLPFDLEKDNFQYEFLADSNLYVFVQGRDKDLPYLTPFLDVVENLDGEFNTEFEIAGTFNDPVKNGSVTIRKGNLVIEQLENRIEDINGTGKLVDNVLNLDIKAKWPAVQYTLAGILGLSGASEEAESNMQVDGTIDLTHFSHIGFDLNARGENLSIVALGEDVNLTSGDVNLNVKGYDPISITGDFEVREGYIGFEFNSLGGGPVNNAQETVGFEYVINMPIEKIYLRNQFIDATLEGEAIMIKHPYLPDTHIGGSLTVTDGLFSYWASVFELQEGSITLDQFEGNHELNFTAYKEISDNIIIASISGELDNPEINFSDNNNELSQAEIVRALTIGEIEGVFSDLGEATASASATTTALLALVERPLEQQAQKFGNVGGLDRIDIKGGEGTYIDSISVLVGGRIGRNFYLTYEGSQDDPLNIEVEYRLNNKVSVIATADDESVSGAVRLRIQY